MTHSSHPKDFEIAEAAEKTMRPITELAASIGILPDELILHGKYIAKIDFKKVLQRLANSPNAKYIDVTAITPTPLGEGKSTTAIGLVDGLAKRNQRAIATMRQPSACPTMNIKGSAAGGGLSQIIPLTPFSLGLTGDINAVINAHNLGMVALTARLQHEANYNDATLAKKNLRRLDIDPHNIQIGWVIDFCAQALRNVVIGLGTKKDHTQCSRDGERASQKENHKEIVFPLVIPPKIHIILNT